MTTKKPFYKKFLFWLVTTPLVVVFFLFLPYFKFLFEYYVYNPPANPPAEDFFVMPEKTPPEFQGLKGMPKEVVEVKADGANDTRIVEHHRDGYTLELPSYLSVSTWDMEPATVMVTESKDGADCNARVYKMKDAKTVQEAFEVNHSYYQEENDIGMYNILRHDLEPIKENDVLVEAYIEQFEDDMMGYHPSLLIQGDKEVFAISQNGMRYPECTLMMDVLKGFKI